MTITPHAHIFPDCDPQIRTAISSFLVEWERYSATSRGHFSIFRLVEKLLDPVWIDWQKQHPIFNCDTLDAVWRRFEDELDRIHGAGTCGDLEGELRRGRYPLSTIARRCGFFGLNRFLELSERIARGIRYEKEVAALDSLYSLRSIVHACALKKPKTRGELSSTRANPKSSMCSLCGESTELTLQNLNLTWRPSNLEGAERLRPSVNYCCTHRPKNPDGKLRKEYFQASRSKPKFDQEYSRMSFQFLVNDALANNNNSTNKWIEKYIRCLTRHKHLIFDANIYKIAESKFELKKGITSSGYLRRKKSKNLSDPAECELNEYAILMESRIRNESRNLVDLKISDRKKEIMMRVVAGQSPNEIAAQMGINFQTVQRSLNSVPKGYRMHELTNEFAS